MIRKTSLDAYYKIKNNGLLSARRWEAYALLFNHGPATAMELLAKKSKGIADSQIRARLNELRQMGVVDEVKVRSCAVTGQSVIEWDVNDRLPVKYKQLKKVKCKACNGRGFIKGKL